jgi:hypothetical protein
MRYVTSLPVDLMMGFFGPALAAEESRDKLFGSWRLILFQVQFSDGVEGDSLRIPSPEMPARCGQASG